MFMIGLSAGPRAPPADRVLPEAHLPTSSPGEKRDLRRQSTTGATRPR